MRKKRVAIYARVSTLDKQNPKSQSNLLKNYALARGFFIVGEFVDKSSGHISSRPELNKMMNLARKRKIDIVLVFRFDRFARSTKHLLTALEDFQSLGIDFISYTESIDTSTPSGKMLYVVISAFASFEREIIVSRVKSGLLEAKRKGQRLGRPPLPEHIKTRIVELRDQGYSIGAIAEVLKVSKGVVHKTLKKEDF